MTSPSATDPARSRGAIDAIHALGRVIVLEQWPPDRALDWGPRLAGLPRRLLGARVSDSDHAIESPDAVADDDMDEDLRTARGVAIGAIAGAGLWAMLLVCVRVFFSF